MVPIDSILASRGMPTGLPTSKKFRQIRSSIEEIGLIEPLTVTAIPKDAGRYMLLDGHMRLLAMHELGQSAEASWHARDELERARAFGAPRALGVALRALGRVTEDVSLLREAVTVLDGSAAQLERARAHLVLGSALRVEGELDEARESLRLAIDLAHRCGARALEDAGLSELRATGARPRRRLTTGVGSLTPSERRIAELAAAGQQNREIAETLFVTTATVEYHLRNAYRKLGIASRTQLGSALG